MIRVIKYNDLNNNEKLDLLKRTETNLDKYIEGAKPIIEQVKAQGDAALVALSNQFDGSNLSVDQIQVTEEEFEAAFNLIPADVLDSIKYAIDNVSQFHKAQMPESMWFKEVKPGIYAGERVTPIDKVALYIPRGKGSFPSTAIMLTVPAKIANVPVAYILTPCGKDNTVDPATLVVAKLVGIDKVYRAGGVLAAAAAAFGTKTIPKAYKIIGPGSPWLMAAKKILADEIDPGIKAGPTEAIVLADEHANPEHVALDMLIEAEHGSDSSAYLVTNSSALVDKVLVALEKNIAEMEPSRAEFASTVLSGSYGGILITETLEQGLDFINDYAPEHLQIQTSDPFDVLGKVRNASEILLGSRVPFSIGNYVLGPNAVLPTASGALTVSALSVHDFLKSSSIGYVTEEGFKGAAEHTARLAQYEGFNAHRRAVLKPR